jgi:aspartate/methionine/tyrosine aminotransferase
MAVQVVVPETKGGGTPAVMMPNPFYHAYAGAVAATGADAIFLPVTKELNFLPDLEAISNETWAQTAAFFICSPANPQGSAASCEYYARLVSLARQHDFVVLADECYAEIYDSEPPVSVLEVCAAENNLSNVLSFHSLSKRSNVPGLRSGFVAGNEDLISAFRTVRTFGGAIPPGPTYAASTALFNDDAHVEANRALYREKFDAAEKILSGRFGFYRPDGGFFLWLDVGDGIAATTKLWRQAGIKVLPGAFLGHEDGDGHNPGAPYIRLAVVHDIEVTTRALTKLCDVL